MFNNLIAIHITDNTFGSFKTALKNAYIGRKVTLSDPDYGDLEYIVYADLNAMKWFDGSYSLDQWLRKYEISNYSIMGSNGIIHCQID